MRTPTFLLASLDAVARFARGGLTLGLAATLVGPMACDTSMPPGTGQIVDPSVTPYTALHGALSSMPACVLEDTHNVDAQADFAEGDMAMMPEPEMMASAPRAPRALARQEATPWRGGRSMAASSGELFVVDTGNGTVVVFDQSELSLIRTMVLGATTRPEQIVVGPAGDAWVTLRHGRSVAHIPAGGVDADLTVEVGTEPYGLALSPDGSRLYVTLAGEDELLVLDGVTGEQLGQVATAPHPRSVVFSDRMTVAVVHLDAGIREYEVMSDGTLGDLEQDVAVREGNPWQLVTLDFLAQDLLGSESDPIKSHYATRAVAATTDPERGDVYVAHVQVAPGTVEQLLFASLNGPSVDVDTGPPAQGEAPEQDSPGSGGGSAYGVGASTRFNTVFRPVEPSITRLHGKGTGGTTAIVPPVMNSEEQVLAHRLDQPMDILHHPTRSLLFLVGQGTDNVLVFNSAMPDPMSSPVAEIAVGHGPKAITFSDDGTKAFVLNAHASTVGAIDLTQILALGGAGTAGCGEALATLDGPLSLGQNMAVSLGIDPLPAAVQRGRRIFHNARNSHLNVGDQFACATCHLEGTEDKRVWLVLEGQRQTPSLAGRLADTAPFNWQGTEEELQNNMSKTIERMGGLGLSASELVDLEQFMLHGLVAPPNPHLVGDELSDEQAFGKEIFERADVGCANCHTGAGTTDGQLHDVGTASRLELEMMSFAKGFDGNPEAALPDSAFDLNTPSLRGLFYTAPYLHDGSAATLRDVLTQTATTMGRTDHLSEDELEALVAYLLTL